MVVRNCGGSFELDTDAASALSARRLRLLQRGTRITGRYGRRGMVHGEAHEHQISAVISEGADVGSIELIFDDAFGAFAGTMRIGTREIALSGKRTVRRRPAP